MGRGDRENDSAAPLPHAVNQGGWGGGTVVSLPCLCSRALAGPARALSLANAPFRCPVPVPFSVMLCVCVCVLGVGGWGGYVGSG